MIASMHACMPRTMLTKHGCNTVPAVRYTFLLYSALAGLEERWKEVEVCATVLGLVRCERPM